ncbi:MAG: A/G-specific adenine glycosylase [Crocinitomicaceae bacterium]
MNSFHAEILMWYSQNKRDLPWRLTKDPYRIWLSEIILQQTRVEQGLAYYEKFVKRFPSIFDLAKASEDDVLKLWEGLGYYSRGRNLLATAKRIVQEYSGQFPVSASELRKLKGIGPYTSAAISSIANNEKVAAVDGNAFRVLSRFFDIEKDISLNSTRKYFENLMTELIEGDNPGDFNQAVMDIGAMICTPKNYDCGSCPLNFGCLSLKEQKIEERPVKTKKLKITDRFLHFLIIKDDTKIALERRSEGIWNGLYQFPLIESDSKDLSISDLRKRIDQKVDRAKMIHQLQKPHKLSHQNLHISFWELDAEDWEKKFDIQDLSLLSFPKPLNEFIKQFILEVNI